MSRIGKLPIPVPSGVDVSIDGRTVTVKGPKGTLSHTVAEPITVAQEDGTIQVGRPDDERAVLLRDGDRLDDGVRQGALRPLHRDVPAVDGDLDPAGDRDRERADA